MDPQKNVPTAIGTPIRFGDEERGRGMRPGAPPVVLQAQAYGFIPLETPEQLRQWEADARLFYGVDIDASRLGGGPARRARAGAPTTAG